MALETDTGTSSAPTDPTGRSRRRVDALTVVAAVVLVAGLVQLAIGAVTVGVTWDEPTHVDRAQALFDEGWFVPDWQLVDGEPDDVSPFVYGPAHAVTAHAANVLVGNEQPGQLSRTADAYAVRHLTVAVLAALAAVAVGGMGWWLTGSRRAGLVTAAALVAIPAWTGHGMFNVKDAPAAVGYTLVTAGLVLALAPADVGPGRRVRSGLIATSLALGVFVGVGTRLAFWAPLGASLATFLVLWVLRRRGGHGPGRAAPITVAVGAGVGLLGLVAAYPQALRTPGAWLIGSVAGSSAYPWDGLTLTAGRLLASLDLPWWYLPVWVGATIPVLLLVLAGVGLVRVMEGVVPRPDGAGWWDLPARAAGGVLVAQQALLLPLLAIVTGSVMYDGLRQHLYVVPALAVLAGLGAHRVIGWADRAGARRWRLPVATGLVALALVAPTVEQALLFPYNYTYVNPVGGIGGVDGRWETDYWKASGREAVTRVPQDAELICSSLVRPHLDAGPFSGPCQADVTTFEHLRGTDVAQGADADAGTWVIGRRTEGNQVPDHCRRVDDVTRWLRGEQVVMAFVLVCEPGGF